MGEKQQFLPPQGRDQREPLSPFDIIPNHIITSIISYLPIDEAARTSTLSLRWRDLWTWVTDFSLHGGDRGCETSWLASKRLQAAQTEGKKCCLTTKEVDQILSSHKAVFISNFRIVLCVEHHSPSDVNRWVGILERKGIQQLALLNCRRHRNSDNLFLTESLIGRKALCELELSSCKLLPGSFQDSKNLRTLKLQNIALKAETLEGILSNCVALEKLFLRECSKLERVTICSPSNLRVLELTKFDRRLARVEIKAQNLHILVSDMVEKIQKIDAPNLKILSSGRVFFEDTLTQRYEAPDDDDNRRLRHWPFDESSWCRNDAEFLGHYFSLHGESPIKRRMHEFDKMQGLFINLDLDDISQSILIAFVLRKCTHLREVDIKLLQGSSPPAGRDGWEDYWEKRVSPDCVAHRLKKTRLTGFTAKDLQLGFAKFLISKAPMLGELQIRFHKNFPERLVESHWAELLSVPRASLNVRLTLDSR